VDVIDLLPAGVAVKLGRIGSGVVIGDVAIDTIDTAMLLLYAANVLDDITLEFDTAMVVADDAAILRLTDEAGVLDTAIDVAVTFKFPNDVIAVIVLKNLVAMLSVPVT
jgi:hypothetical protein